MLKISFTGDSDSRLIQVLRSRPAALLRVLSVRLNALMFQLQSKIVSEKLSGQVLKRRTGILSGSIRAMPAEVEGAKITAEVLGGGGPAFYAATFEEGCAPYQIMAVRARALRFMVDGRAAYAKSVSHPAMYAPFMRPSLEEFTPQIRTDLQAALDAELNKP
jgi:hypothetical protein